MASFLKGDGIMTDKEREEVREAGRKAMKEEIIEFLKKKTIPCYGGNRLILRTDWKELLK